MTRSTDLEGRVCRLERLNLILLAALRSTPEGGVVYQAPPVKGEASR